MSLVSAVPPNPGPPSGNDTPPLDQSCWLGHVITWFKNVFDAIGQFFKTCFSCCFNPPAPSLRIPPPPPKILPPPPNLLVMPPSLAPASDTLSTLASTRTIYHPLVIKAALVLLSKNSAFDPMLTKPQAGQELGVYEEQLRGHVAALVHFMRGGETHEAVSEKHLLPIHTLLIRLGVRTLPQTPEAIVAEIASKLKIEFDEVKALLLPLATEKLNALKLLTRPASPLEPAPKKPLTFDLLEEAKCPKSVFEMLKFIASYDFSDFLLNSPFVIPETLREKRDAHSLLQIEKLKEIHKALQEHLCAIIQGIRISKGSIAPKTEELIVFVELLKLAQIDFRTLGSFSTSLTQFLAPSAPKAQKTFKVCISIYTLADNRAILEAPKTLSPPNSNFRLPSLQNIGNTCYLDSILWMLARFTTFDDLLTGSLKESGIIEVDLSRRVLQGHLCAIVNLLRTSKSIDRSMLLSLSVLLEYSGWCRLGFQQDPQELLRHLTNIFEVEGATIPSMLKIVDILEWKIGSENKLSTKEDVAQEINLDLPLINLQEATPARRPEWVVAPDYCTMDDLVDFNGSTELKEYRPNEGSEIIPTTKTTFIIDPAPTTLFIHEKRFTKHDRVNGSIPVFDYTATGIERYSPSITIPIYTKNDDSDEYHQKEVKTYRLKAAICHSGTSQESGHYVIYCLQDVNEAPLWIKYDDSNQEEYLNFKSEDENFKKGVQEAINLNGYYLVYEIDPQ